jgi:hypothetical protein
MAFDGVSSIELSFKRHLLFFSYSVSPRPSGLDDARVCAAKSRAFPFLKQQSGTPFGGLASWFARFEKPATMTLCAA